jgi:hypothetical protein
VARIGSGEDRRAWALLAIVAIALLAIALALPAVLDDRGFSLHGAWVLDVIQNGNWISPRNQSGDVVTKPPLYVWLAALSTLPFGRISLLTMLLPNAVATLATAAIVQVLGGAAFGARAGLLGALAYLLSYAGASQVALARPDGVFACAVTAAAFAAFRAWNAGRGWTWFWVAAAAATLTKGPLGLLLGGLGLLAAPWERWNGRAAALRGSHLTGVVLFLLITGGWLGLAYLERGQALIDRLIFRELLGHATAISEGPEPGHPFFLQPVNFVWSFAPWSLFACIAFWRVIRRPALDAGERRAERFLFCWFLGGLLLFSLAPHQRERHLLSIVPPAAVMAGRELARLARASSAGALRRACAGAVVVALSVMAVVQHQIVTGSERVQRAQGLQALARSIRDRVGDGFPLTHMDTPFAFRFFLSSMSPNATAQQAASLIAGPEAAFVAIHDLDALRAALGEAPAALHVVARWPATGEAFVRVVSNQPRLEWTSHMSMVVGPLVVRTHGLRLVRRQGPEFVLRETGAVGEVIFGNESSGPERVRARIVESPSSTVLERVLAPGEQWRLASRG